MGRIDDALSRAARRVTGLPVKTNYWVNVGGPRRVVAAAVVAVTVPVVAFRMTQRIEHIKWRQHADRGSLGRSRVRYARRSRSGVYLSPGAW